MKATAILIVMLMFVLAAQGWAGDSRRYVGDTQATPGQVNKNTKMALHLIQHSGSCKGVTISSRADIVKNLDTWSTDPSTGGIDAFLVVFDYDSITGIEYGLSWPSEWGTASTKICIPSPISVGGIVNPGDGISISWVGATCKIPSNHGGADAPFLLVASTWVIPSVGGGEIVIKDNPPTGATVVQSCRDGEFRGPESVDSVFDAGALMPTGLYEGPPRFATEPSTWGSIKAMFK
jgi:hypothetical protein